jgi:hypothetical protein
MDTGDLLGPKYSFADELPTPSELAIGRDGSFSGIMRAVAGVNYYVDAIGFGEATGLAKMTGFYQTPLGIQYFMKTGATCSNGADMYEYVSTAPKGLQGRVGKEVQRTMGVQLRGLAPGIAEDAISALNPLPLFKSVMGSGYAQCKKVTLPVGDLQGKVRSGFDPKNVWITDPYKVVNGMPNQTRWVMDKYITQEEYDAAPKTEQSGVLPNTEGFSGDSGNTIAAGILFAALFLGVAAWAVRK